MRSYTADEVRRAVERLRRVQPTADRIRYGECHCRKRGLMLSFADQYTHPRGTDEHHEESCGYWCAACNWGNAGGRLVDPTEDTYANWNDDTEAAR